MVILSSISVQVLQNNNNHLMIVAFYLTCDFFLKPKTGSSLKHCGTVPYERNDTTVVMHSRKASIDPNQNVTMRSTLDDTFLHPPRIDTLANSWCLTREGTNLIFDVACDIYNSFFERCSRFLPRKTSRHTALAITKPASWSFQISSNHKRF